MKSVSLTHWHKRRQRTAGTIEAIEQSTDGMDGSFLKVSELAMAEIRRHGLDPYEFELSRLYKATADPMPQFELQVRKSGAVTRLYHLDPAQTWLEALAADIEAGRFD